MRFPRLITLITMAAVSAVTLCARVKWIEKDYDFGLMKEVAGPKTGVSRFVVEGPDSISVFNVRPSCGCTSADWDDDLHAPGDTVNISYTYDPHLRPGKFDKSVKVMLSDGSYHVIRITGNVLGTPESLSTMYPLDAGEFRLSETLLNLGDVNFGRNPVAFVNAYILSQDTIAPVVSTEAKGILVTPSVDKGGPGDLITYTVSLRSAELGQYGPVEIPLGFSAPGSENVTVPLRAYIVPDADMLMRTSKGKIPVCETRPDPIDFGSVGINNGKLQSELTIHNAGNGPLQIFRVLAENPAVSFGKVPASIKPGKSATVKIELDTSKLSAGPLRSPVTILSSDPRNPRINIPIVLLAR